MPKHREAEAEDSKAPTTLGFLRSMITLRFGFFPFSAFEGNDKPESQSEAYLRLRRDERIELAAAKQRVDERLQIERSAGRLRPANEAAREAELALNEARYGKRIRLLIEKWRAENALSDISAPALEDLSIRIMDEMGAEQYRVWNAFRRQNSEM